MFETLDKLMLAGLGAMSMTKERAEQIFDEYVEKGRVTRDQRSGFVRDLLDQSTPGHGKNNWRTGPQGHCSNEFGDERGCEWLS
jgi:polyhydroxyalkanoate synthesis regulator phasin